MSSCASLFKRFKGNHKVFIETGLLNSCGVHSALQAGFDQIFSIEMDKLIVDREGPQFASRPQVHIINDRSEKALGPLLQQFSEPVLLWLDAHTFWGGMGGGILMPGTNLHPLYEELEAVTQHPVKTHTILIDDVRCFSQMGYNYDAVVAKLKTINPAYIIQRVNSEGNTYKDDVIAAVVL